MTAEELGNPLSVPPTTVLEYLVHGKFFRSSNDLNGLFGAFWYSLPELRKFFSRAALEEILNLADENHTTTRDDVLDDIDEAIAEAERQAGE